MSSVDGFYRAFEERFYAPREVIKKLRRQYLPFTDPVARAYPGGKTFDIGCGRGEWLELMQDSGMQPFGVDLDEGMLDGCRELSLPALQGDAVAHLTTLGDASQTIVTAFHVVEHLSFEQLRVVVGAAHRVLVPGGLLIMETPNPENYTVATSGFHLDPTHQRPIPPQLLAFLPEYTGFARVKIMRLQESPEVAADPAPDLLTVLRGVSPDYAVVAQKEGPEELLEGLRPLFEREYGLSLDTLAGRHQRQAEARASTSEARAGQAESRATRAEERAIEAERRASHAEAQAQTVVTQFRAIFDEAKVYAENRAQEAEARAKIAEAALEQASAQLNAVFESVSWRITGPLRLTGSLVLRPAKSLRSGVNHIVHRSINGFQRPLSIVIGVVLRRQRVSHRIQHWLMPYPALRKQLLDVARRNGIVREQPHVLPACGIVSAGAPLERVCHLNPRAREIYQQIKTATAERKGQS